MQRLIDDANRVKQANGEMGDLSIDSFADVTEAIHIMQTEMGITGTTASEAATTIEGSISMMKGAWQNLVVGMADENANMEVLITNFVDSTATAAENLIPRIEQTLAGIGSLIENLAPIIGEAVPRLIETVLPSLLAGGINLITALVTGIVSAAPGIYQALLDAIYLALTDVFGMSEESAGSFVGTLNGIVMDLVGLLTAAFNAIASAISWLVEQAQTEGTIFNAIWETIATVVTTAIDVARGVIQTFTAILEGDWETALNTALSTASTVFDAIQGAITNPIEMAWEVVSSIIEKLTSAFDFDWSLPPLSLPHISVSGGVAPYGIGGKGSLPSFSIEWYRKAYDRAMVLSNPTIFGYSDGKFLGGGDGNGNEVVAGEAHLMDMIGSAVANNSQNDRVVGLLSAILDALLSGQTFQVGEREFARLVREYA